MKVITVRSQILELPERIKESWCHKGAWRTILRERVDTESVYDRVNALDLTMATVEDVAAAMKPCPCWIDETSKCDECGQKSDAVVQLGEELDVESRTANVCGQCLTAALVNLRHATATAKEK